MGFLFRVEHGFEILWLLFSVCASFPLYAGATSTSNEAGEKPGYMCFSNLGYMLKEF
jgi:hypothetical protein